MLCAAAATMPAFTMRARSSTRCSAVLVLVMVIAALLKFANCHPTLAVNEKNGDVGVGRRDRMLRLSPWTWFSAPSSSWSVVSVPLAGRLRATPVWQLPARPFRAPPPPPRQQQQQQQSLVRYDWQRPSTFATSSTSRWPSRSTTTPSWVRLGTRGAPLLDLVESVESESSPKLVINRAAPAWQNTQGHEFDAGQLGREGAATGALAAGAASAAAPVLNANQAVANGAAPWAPSWTSSWTTAWTETKGAAPSGTRLRPWTWHTLSSPTTTPGDVLYTTAEAVTEPTVTTYQPVTVPTTSQPATEAMTSTVRFPVETTDWPGMDSFVVVTRAPRPTDVTEGHVITTDSPVLTDVTEGPTTVTNAPVLTDTTGGSITVTNAPVLTDVTEGLVTVTNSPVLTDVTEGSVIVTNVPVWTEMAEGHAVATDSSVLTDVTDESVTVTNAPVLTDMTESSVTVTIAPVWTDMTEGSVTVTNAPVSTDMTEGPVTVTNVPVLTYVTEGSATETNAPVSTDMTEGPVTVTNVPVLTYVTEGSVTEPNAPVLTDVTESYYTTTHGPVLTDVTEGSVSVTESPDLIDVTGDAVTGDAVTGDDSTPVGEDWTVLTLTPTTTESSISVAEDPSVTSDTENTVTVTTESAPISTTETFTETNEPSRTAPNLQDETTTDILDTIEIEINKKTVIPEMTTEDVTSEPTTEAVSALAAEALEADTDMVTSSTVSLWPGTTEETTTILNLPLVTVTETTRPSSDYVPVVYPEVTNSSWSALKDFNYYDGVAFEDVAGGGSPADTYIPNYDSRADEYDGDYFSDRQPPTSDTKGLEIASLVRETPERPTTTTPSPDAHRRSDVLIEDDDEEDSNDVDLGPQQAGSPVGPFSGKDTFEGQMLRRMIPLVVRQLRMNHLSPEDVDRLRYIFGPIWPEVEQLAGAPGVGRRRRESYPHYRRWRDPAAAARRGAARGPVNRNRKQSKRKRPGQGMKQLSKQSATTHKNTRKKQEHQAGERAHQRASRRTRQTRMEDEEYDYEDQYEDSPADDGDYYETDDADQSLNDDYKEEDEEEGEDDSGQMRVLDADQDNPSVMELHYRARQAQQSSSGQASSPGAQRHRHEEHADESMAMDEDYELY